MPEEDDSQGIQQGAFKLATLPESGKPPETRVKSAKKAQDDVISLIEGARTRMRRWAMIKGMFQGNPPYNQEKRRAAGLGWAFNIATLEGKGILSAACAPYYDLFASGQHYAAIQTSAGNSPDEQQKWSQIITEEFDYMLKAWREFDYHVWQMIQNFIGYGRGFLMFSDAFSWQFEHVPHEMVLIPDGVPASIDKLKSFVVLENMSVVELYGYIKDKSSATDAGWNVSAVRAAIRGATPHDNAQDVIAAQQSYNDADGSPDSKEATVQLAHYLVCEFSGKWSHFIVLRDENAARHNATEKQREAGEIEFLYKSIGKRDHITELICPFIYELLDNTWNGASGIGKDIFSLMQAKDRIRNNQLDNLLMRGSLLLQAQKASDRQKLQLFNIGPVTIIPENCTPIQSSFIGDIESSIAVNADLNNMIAMNTAVYRPQQEKPQGNPETATAATLRFQQATILGGSAVNRFYNQMDPVYDEMYRRATDKRIDKNLGPWAEAASDFIQRCKDRGVPIEAIRKPKTVRAWRAVGNGSPFLRQQALGMLASVAASFPEGGRVAWLRDYVASISNYTTVQRYVPEPELAERPSDQRAQAVEENFILSHGGKVLITPTQNDVIHATSHLEDGMAPAFLALEQGADPLTVLAALEGIGPHAGEHIQRLTQDSLRQGDYKALLATWKEYAKQTDKIAQAIRQQQESGQGQQQPGQVDPELQKMLAELELKKQELMMRLQIEQEKLRMDKQRFEAELKFKRDEHELDMKLKQEEHKQKLQIADSQNAMQIRNQRRLTESKVNNGGRE